MDPFDTKPDYTDIHRLLTDQKVECERVVSVDVEQYPGSVLFLGGEQCAMTAWIYHEDGKTSIKVQSGFSIDPED